MPRYIVGFVHRAIFLWRYNPVSALNFVLSLLGFAFVILGLAVRNAWALALSICGVLATAIALLHRFRRDQQYFLSDVAHFPPAGFVQAVAKERSRLFRQGTAQDRIALIDDAAVQALWSTSSVVMRVEELACPPNPVDYRLPDPIDKNIQVLLNLRRTGLDTTNETKVRFFSPVTAAALNNKAPILLQKSDYFSGILTHEMARHVFRSKCSPTALDGTSYYFKDGTIVPIDKSSASNHIGVSTLAITSDLRLIYQTQKRSLVDPGRLGPSGSGSLDWDDIRGAEEAFGIPLTLSNLLRFGCERELAEEMSSTPDRAYCRTHITGFARLIDRGGKPDFYGVSVLRQRSQELRVRSKEEQFVAEIKSIDIKEFSAAGLVNLLESAVKTYQRADSAGMPLCLSFHFALERLQRDPGFWTLIEQDYTDLHR